MEKIYSEDFTGDEKKKIISSLKQALGAAGFKVEKVWGETIEDRGSQITFCAFGQQAPIEVKKNWDPDFTTASQQRLGEKLPPSKPISSAASISQWQPAAPPG